MRFVRYKFDSLPPLSIADGGLQIFVLLFGQTSFQIPSPRLVRVEISIDALFTPGLTFSSVGSIETIPDPRVPATSNILNPASSFSAGGVDDNKSVKLPSISERQRYVNAPMCWGELTSENVQIRLALDIKAGYNGTNSIYIPSGFLNLYFC